MWQISYNEGGMRLGVAISMNSGIPTEADWRSGEWCVEVACAYEHFAFRSFEQAIGLFKDNALLYQEDVMFMPAACFPFYAKAYIVYLMSEDSRNDSDGANCFFGIVEQRAKEISGNVCLASRVMACLEHLASQQDFYGADVSVCGSFIDRARQAAHELSSRQS